MNSKPNNIATQKLSLANQIAMLNMPAVQISVIPKPASINSSLTTNNSNNNNNNNNNASRNDHVHVIPKIQVPPIMQSTATNVLDLTTVTKATTATTSTAKEEAKLSTSMKNSAAKTTTVVNKINVYPNAKSDLIFLGKVINPSTTTAGTTISPINIFNTKSSTSNNNAMPSIPTTKRNAIFLPNTNTTVISSTCNAQSKTLVVPKSNQQCQQQRTGLLITKPLPTFMNKNLVKHIVIGGTGNSGTFNNKKIQFPLYTTTVVRENKNNNTAVCHSSPAVMSSTLPTSTTVLSQAQFDAKAIISTAATTTTATTTSTSIPIEISSNNNNKNNFFKDTALISSTTDDCVEFLKIQNIPKTTNVIKTSSAIIKSIPAMATAISTPAPATEQAFITSNVKLSEFVHENTKDNNNFEQIDDVENLRKWSEALAKKQTVQISDSVILSVAKSNNNNNVSNNKVTTINANAANNNSSPCLSTSSKILPNKTLITTAQNNNNNKTNMEKVFPTQQPTVVLLNDKTKIDVNKSLLQNPNPIEIPELEKKQENRNDAEEKEKNKMQFKIQDLENEINLLTIMTNKVKRSVSLEENASDSTLIKNAHPERRHSISSTNEKTVDENLLNNVKSQHFEDTNKENISQVDEDAMESDDDDVDDSVLIIEEEEEQDEQNQDNDDDNKDSVDMLQEKEKELVNGTKSPLKLSTLSAAMVEQKQNLLSNNNHNKSNDKSESSTSEAKLDQKLPSVPTVIPTTIAAINLDSDEELSSDYKIERLDEQSTTKAHANLLCDEEILLNSSSSSSNNSNQAIANNDNGNGNQKPEQKPTKEKRHQNTYSKSAKIIETQHRTVATDDATITADIDSFSSTLDILSAFNMLTWRERIGSARGSSVRFQLNEFNLIQIYERVKPRISLPSIFERPILKRDEALNAKLRTGQTVVDPFLYLCRRCCCHGPATEFLAPEFCSLECLKQRGGGNSRKRTHADVNAANRELQVLKKRARTFSMPQNVSPPGGSSSNSLNDANFGNSLSTFQWVKYLKNSSCAAPINLFPNPFPTGPNRFEIDMKLEAIDPENCSLCCVCTVVKIAGYRLKLSFDGYDSMYDFWVNADSMDIFPPGWCQKTTRILQPPLGISAEDFNWHSYLAKTHGTPAPRTLFTHLNAATMPSRNPFKIGMYLEAEDLNDTGKLCVATVADVLNDRLRIHFDGWDDCYDYWVDTNSPYIHAVGWHEGRQKLVPPPGYAYGTFSWPEYLRRVGGVPAPSSYFSARDPIDFKPNMKLEVVDPRIPDFIRPATVTARKGHRIKVHLDLWPPSYCFWLEDDSPDIHPIGWCDATGHELEAPPGYKMRNYRINSSQSHFVGCRNVGNAKNYQFNNHITLDECPYALQNWRFKPQKPRRVQGELIVVNGKSAPLQPLLSPSPVSKQSNVNNNNNNNNNNYTKIKPEPVTTKSTTATTTTTANRTVTTHQNVENSDTKKSTSSSKVSTDVATSRKRSASAQTEINEKIKKEFKTDAECVQYIAKEFLCDYGPRLQQSQELWQKHILNSNVTLNEAIESNPLSWSATDVATFVERILKSNTAATAFLKEDIDGGSFLQLRQSDITDTLNLPLGPALKLYAHILNLRAICMCKFQMRNQSFK